MREPSMGRRTMLAAVMGGLAAGAQPATAGDYEYYQAEGGRVDVLDASDGSVVWSVRTRGGGQPVVDEDHVYRAGLDDVVARDRSDGSVVWRHRHLRKRRWEESLDWTVAVDDGTVYSEGGDGTPVALDAGTGERLWSGVSWDDSWASTPPVVGDGVVYVGSGGKSSGVVALDVATGERVWTEELPEGTPDQVTVHGETVYAVADEALVAVDATNGDRTWTIVLENQITGPVTGTVDGTTLGVTRSGDTLVGFDPDGGTTNWERDFDLLAAPYPVRLQQSIVTVADDAVYVPNNDIEVIDLETGADRSSVDTKFVVQGRPTFTEDSIVATGDPRRVGRFGRDGERHWYTRIEKDVGTGNWKTFDEIVDEQWLVHSPVIADGIVYVTSDRIRKRIDRSPTPTSAPEASEGPGPTVPDAAEGSDWTDGWLLPAGVAVGALLGGPAVLGGLLKATDWRSGVAGGTDEDPVAGDDPSEDD